VTSLRLRYRILFSISIEATILLLLYVLPNISAILGVDSVTFLALETTTELPLIYVFLFVFTETTDPIQFPSDNSADPRVLLEEYRTLNTSVRQRENSLLLAGSIFVTASLILLGQSSIQGSQKVPVVFGSWAVYSIWLFLFQLSSARLTELTFARLRGLEQNMRLRIQSHTFLFTKRDPVRRYFWLWVLNAILVLGDLLLGLDRVAVISLSLTIPIQALIIMVNHMRKDLLKELERIKRSLL